MQFLPRLKEESGVLSVLFKPLEVGTFVMDIYHASQKIAESPVFFKVYDSSLIKVSDIRNGVVGQPSQFRVDASQASAVLMSSQVCKHRARAKV